MAEPELVVCADPVTRTAALLADALSERIEAGRRARLAIPGGSALGAVGPARARLGRAAWSEVELTWTDERCAPFVHADSCRGAAYREGALDPSWPVAAELPLYLDDEPPADAVERVARALTRRFGGGLDVVLLGMGPDGHVASLFPGRLELAATGLAAFVPDSPKPPPERITLTRAVLASASRVLLLATGAGKRDALARLLDADPALPASGLTPLTIVTDVQP